MHQLLIQFVIALGAFSSVLATNYHYEISGGGDSGTLLVNGRPICYTSEFDGDLADGACEGVGYGHSTDVYSVDLDTSSIGRPTICDIEFCNAGATSLNECNLRVAISGCPCSHVIGITCAHGPSVEMIIMIVVIVLIVIGTVVGFIFCTFCCKSCPCYYKRHQRTLVVTRRAPQIVTMTPPAASGNTAPRPPAYNPSTGYQPVPPTATTDK